jgi:hypothetical protein
MLFSNGLPSSTIVQDIVFNVHYFLHPIRVAAECLSGHSPMWCRSKLADEQFAAGASVPAPPVRRAA